jgi:hypothetical protein
MTSTNDDHAWVGEVLDALDIGVFRIDNVTQRILRINAKCARIFGFRSPEEAVGYSAVEMYEDPKERREVATRFAASEEFRRTGIARLEGRRVRIDTREPFDAAICLKAVGGTSGGAGVIEGTTARIGDPTSAETAFRLGERRFRAPSPRMKPRSAPGRRSTWSCSTWWFEEAWGASRRSCAYGQSTRRSGRS